MNNNEEVVKKTVYENFCYIKLSYSNTNFAFLILTIGRQNFNALSFYNIQELCLSTSTPLVYGPMPILTTQV